MLVESPHTDSQTPLPRSKVEFLYRDLIVQYERLQATNDEISQRQREIAIAVSGVPGALRQAAIKVAAEASNEAGHQMFHAKDALAAAQADLQRTHHALQRWSLRNACFVATVAGVAGLAGGLLGALITLVLLQR